MSESMTKQEMILDYMSKNPNPIQSKCPIVIQRWPFVKNQKSGHIYWNSETGKRTDFQPVVDSDRCQKYHSYRAVSSYGYEFIYTDFVEEYNMLVVGKVRLSGHRHKDGEIEQWTWVDKIYETTKLFLFRNDTHPYNENGTEWCPLDANKYYNKSFVKWLKHLSSHYNYSDFTNQEFVKFIGTPDFKINQYTDSINGPWAWSLWYTKSAPRKESATQKSLNEIDESKLIPLSTLSERYPITCPKENNPYNKKITDYLHFEIINEKLCIIRYLKRQYEGCEEYNQQFYEDSRIYITDKGKVTIAEYNKAINKFCITSAKLSSVLGSYNRHFIKFGNIEELANWKCLSWIKDAATGLIDIQVQYSNINIAEALVIMLRHPIIEKLYKAGYNNIAKFLIQNTEVTANLKHYFGIKETNKGNITKIFNCSKELLTWINNNCLDKREARNGEYYNTFKYNILGVPSALKEIFGEDLNSWSKESVDTYCKPMSQILSKGSNWRSIMLLTGDFGYYYYSRSNNNNFRQLTPEEKRICIHFLKMGKKDSQLLDTYIDIVNMYKRLNEGTKPEFDSVYKMNSMYDLQHYHDDITVLYNYQQAERRAYWDAQEKERLERDNKKFEKLQEGRRIRFNYENEEDEFLIKVPENLVELTTEGETLRHCVASYIHRHAEGDTNIIFLRKKSAPNIPYYTIEVKDGQVVQIHGKFNCWLGAAEDAVNVIKFTYKWLKEKHIECQNYILLNKSTSYGKNNEAWDAAELGIK